MATTDSPDQQPSTDTDSTPEVAPEAQTESAPQSQSAIQTPPAPRKDPTTSGATPTADGFEKVYLHSNSRARNRGLLWIGAGLAAMVAGVCIGFRAPGGPGSLLLVLLVVPGVICCIHGSSGARKKDWEVGVTVTDSGIGLSASGVNPRYLWEEVHSVGILQDGALAVCLHTPDTGLTGSYSQGLWVAGTVVAVGPIPPTAITEVRVAISASSHGRFRGIGLFPRDLY